MLSGSTGRFSETSLCTETVKPAKRVGIIKKMKKCILVVYSCALRRSPHWGTPTYSCRCRCTRINSHFIQSVVTGQAPVTLELRNTPRGKKTQNKNQRWYTHLSQQLTQFMPLIYLVYHDMPLRQKHEKKVKSGVSLYTAVCMYKSHYTQQSTTCTNDSYTMSPSRL